jgi:hypothetical protein
MSTEIDTKTVGIYAKVPEEIRRRVKAQAAIAGIDIKDYIGLAIVHFSKHVENNEIDFEETNILN